MLIPRHFDTQTAGSMAQSTTKQKTGKHGTPDETVTVNGSSRLGSKSSDWISALQVEQVSSLEAPTEEWKTRAQLESIFNFKRTKMIEMIGKYLQSGVIERKDFIVMTSNGLRHVKHYRLK